MIADMPAVKNPGLVAILLEEALPNCYVEGIDYTDVEKYGEPTYLHVPKFMEETQKFVREELGVHADVLEEDFKRLMPGKKAPEENEESMQLMGVLSTGTESVSDETATHSDSSSSEDVQPLQQGVSAK